MKTSTPILSVKGVGSIRKMDLPMSLKITRVQVVSEVYQTYITGWADSRRKTEKA